MDYLSHGLWDKYLAYELSLGAHATVAQLYLRLLRMPIQRLDEYRTRSATMHCQGTCQQMKQQQHRKCTLPLQDFVPLLSQHSLLSRMPRARRACCACIR